jgi:tetratricopeptide (TPR) repeat protein
MLAADSIVPMSDPLHTDGTQTNDVESEADRHAKIEQLLLVGLDHYFAARFDHAINVWTRALFIDRGHARARAYIERARNALAERQRESEELLQHGVAAFDRGEGEEARRLLQAAIDGGAPLEEALAVLDRLTRLEAASVPAMPARGIAPVSPRKAGGVSRRSRRTVAVAIASAGLAVAVVVVVALALTSSDRFEWRSLLALAGADDPPVETAAPVSRDAVLPLPRHGEMSLARARSLAAAGHLHDALVALDSIRPTDPQKADADHLRAEIQQQLLALTDVPGSGPADREKGDRRIP